ncbi:MAG: hypothetical protein HGN29_18460 [Asgard group archaeon]|nr:hypothetical protein [Asgard group archaeon]
MYSPSNPGADVYGYVYTDPLLPDTDSDGYIDSVELFSDSDPNDVLSFPEPETITITPPTETITPPPETITENQTVTTTIEGGIVFGVTAATIGLVLTITVVISRRLKKK